MAHCKLHVGNLAVRTTQAGIRETFSAHGKVRSVDVAMDHDTGHPRGFAFVEMGRESEAQAAVEHLDGRDLDGRELEVRIARPREDRGDRGEFTGGDRTRY